jgi:hypothetical protein
MHTESTLRIHGFVPPLLELLHDVLLKLCTATTYFFRLPVVLKGRTMKKKTLLPFWYHKDVLCTKHVSNRTYNVWLFWKKYKEGIASDLSLAPNGSEKSIHTFVIVCTNSYHSWTNISGLSELQGVSRDFPPRRPGFNPRSWCGIWEQSETGAGFLRVFRFPLPIHIPPTAPYSLFILSSTPRDLDIDIVVK